jgi:hypothetical protein
MAMLTFDYSGSMVFLLESMTVTLLAPPAEMIHTCPGLAGKPPKHCWKK